MYDLLVRIQMCFWFVMGLLLQSKYFSILKESMFTEAKKDNEI